MTDKTADFLAAAKRQKKIEEQVARQGENARAALERQAVLDQGGAAAERLREQEEKQRRLGVLVQFADDEIGQIIKVLEGLAPDDDQRSFRVVRDNDLAFGGSVTFHVRYANDDEAKEGLSFAKDDVSAFRLMFMHASFSDESATPLMSFTDFSRMIKDDKTYPEPTKTSISDADDLRGVIGSFVARVAPHRLDDIAAALNPPAASDSAPATLSSEMTLRAPRLPIARQPEAAAPANPAAPAAAPAKRSFFNSILGRK